MQAVVYMRNSIIYAWTTACICVCMYNKSGIYIQLKYILFCDLHQSDLILSDNYAVIYQACVYRIISDVIVVDNLFFFKKDEDKILVFWVNWSIHYFLSWKRKYKIFHRIYSILIIFSTLLKSIIVIMNLSKAFEFNSS